MCEAFFFTEDYSFQHCIHMQVPLTSKKKIINKTNSK